MTKTAGSPRRLPFASFAGFGPTRFGPDFAAGLTLAAIAIPEQMATASLGGFEPQVGLLALVAGAVGFAVFGVNRILSVGADSTITPIFAGGLAAAVAAGAHPDTVALLCLTIGVLLMLGGLFRLGFIANLLSVPVTTGFLAGISGHIVVSQAPALLGVEGQHGTTLDKLWDLAAAAPHANFWTLVIGFGVFFTILLGERIGPRVPAALIAVAAAALTTVVFGLEQKGVAVLGRIASITPTLHFPVPRPDEFVQMLPLALVVAVVIMVQTAATTRSFVTDDVAGPDVDGDFIGVGAANVVAGLVGAFPVNASPPRTAVLQETGSKSQFSGLVAAFAALLISTIGSGLLAHVPHAALAGVLLFVAQRIFRTAVMVDVWRLSKPEFGLIVATFLAVFFLPIQQGVGAGIVLSLLHGVWTTTRARPVEFVRLKGGSVWWPKSSAGEGEGLDGVRVVGFQAPISFLNAYDFQNAMREIALVGPPIRLLVIESNAIVEIDYTGGKAIADFVSRLRKLGVDVAFARLEAVRAQASFQRLGLEEKIGADHIFHSVQEAVDALNGPAARRS